MTTLEPPGDVFVGRRRELAELQRGLEDALGGRGRLFTLVGEPGIGKTRLADELCEVARAGATVAWGRCWEGGGAPAYWPWTQILRTLGRSLDDADLAAGATRAAEDLARFAVEAGTVAPHVEHPEGSEPWPVHDAVAGFFMRLPPSHPLVLVLDDLHAADEPSLNLLLFLVRQLRDKHLLVLGTYREIDARFDPAIASLLARIEREGARVLLAGFSVAEVRDLLDRMTGAVPVDGLVATIARASDGNPLFVREIVRYLMADIDLTRADESTGLLVPQSIREVFRRRLELVGDETLRMLSVASVMGREFDVAVLAAALGEDVQLSESRLEEAERLGIVTGIGAPALYAFSHALLRDAMYDDLTTATRMRSHAQVASALEALSETAADQSHVSELAHHYFKAAHAGDLSKAVDYNIRAGQSAEALGAHDQAMRNYRRALRVADTAPIDDDRRRELTDVLTQAEERAGGLRGTSSPREGGQITASMIREGDYWTIVFRGTTTRLKDTKGLGYIARLCGEPGREFHALDLATSVEGGASDRLKSARADRLHSSRPRDAGAMLDAEAKARYRKRIDDLRDEAEEAEAFGDTERAAAARAEIELIANELARAVGLGGRDRKAADATERARMSVTKALRSAIDNIGKNDRALAQHLSSSIKTGTFCSYSPDPHSQVTWHPSHKVSGGPGGGAVGA